MSLVEADAIRLSTFGLAVLLAWLVWCRWLDMRRAPVTGVRPIQTMGPVHVVTASALMAAAVFVALAAPIVLDPLTWFLDAPGVQQSAWTLIPVISLIGILIERMAYHPRRKAWQAVSWVVIAHVAQWGVWWLARP